MPREIAASRMRDISSLFGSDSPFSHFETVPCDTSAIAAMSDCERPKTDLRICRRAFMEAIIFENEFIRQGILLRNEYLGALQCARGSGRSMQVADIVKEILDVTGWKQAGLAKRLRIAQGTISKWMAGTHTPNKAQWDGVLALIEKDPSLSHLRYEIKPGDVGIMGKVGAGAVIEPDLEQVPPEGFYSVTLPFPLPAEMIAFEIEGDSMYPAEPGTIVVVYKEPRASVSSYVGRTVVVMTEDGRRYLKRLFAGTSPDLYRLESLNAPPIHDVSIAWVGEIFTYLPPAQVIRIDKATRRQSEKSHRAAKR